MLEPEGSDRVYDAAGCTPLIDIPEPRKPRLS